MAEVILPGTYITVRDEGLISAGPVTTGNIGVVGTASKGPVDSVQILGSFSEAREVFGDADQGGTLSLIRALELTYGNGGRTVYAVRTAKSTSGSAAYQTRDSTAGAGTALTKLTAKSPGSWGNEIKIRVSNAESPALVSEQLPGDARQLKRTHVVADSGMNMISVKQKSTGLTLQYKLVYGASPDNAKAEVGIDATTGKLTFPTLAAFLPIAADTIVAQYEVPAANCRKVELTYQSIKETCVVADASHLAEQVNSRSALVSTAKTDETAFYNAQVRNLDTGMLFGTGLDGNTIGSNGEDAGVDEYKASLAKLENEIVNIVYLAGQDNSNSQIVALLQGHLNATAEIKRERIGLIGCNGQDAVGTIAGHSLNSDRLIFVAPGLKVSPTEKLPGSYTAAAMAGLLSALPVQASPTNKALTIPGLSTDFSSSQLEKLVMNRVCAVEKREGFRVVKGITTSTNAAWYQITTRRIVDYAIYGVRSGADPYIGKLNNERVRSALKATLDAFLTRMVADEALISYDLAVSATRAQEIAGEAIVTMTIRPTFSIDFIKVTMYLG